MYSGNLFEHHRKNEEKKVGHRRETVLSKNKMSLYVEKSYSFCCPVSLLDIYLSKTIRLKDISNFVLHSQLSLSVVTFDRIGTYWGTRVEKAGSP